MGKYTPEPRIWEDKHWLYEKYWGEVMSTVEIAEEAGVSKRTITKQMREFGIPIREPGQRGSKSPWSCFYEDAPTPYDERNDVNRWDPEKQSDTKPNWAKIAQKDDAVGDAAQWD